MTQHIAILAGGASRRMGCDKASLLVGAETLLARTIRVARGTGLPVAVVGREAGEQFPGVRFLLDDAPGLGPLGGLLTALNHLESDVVALAGDLPRLSEEALNWLLTAASESSLEDGLVPVNGTRLETLFAVYTRAVLPLADRLTQERELSLIGLIETGRFRCMPLPGSLVPALANANTPEDCEQLGLRPAP